ncbi:MAG: Lrp/AsnC family transcriptional regulator [Rhodospirillaceae bacterium]|nr:Lrp/AsnC family transcriptional regulator [Rhodospirillaceae bacterium]MDE0360972.1 Lrp/AsnC family transcriptional regulator [Rhodospirillaceae bacterium]
MNRKNILNIDRKDTIILNLLQRDGRVSNVRLAEAVGLSEAACLRRVRALEEGGYITGYAARVNASKLGLGSNVFVEITLHQEQQRDLQAFEAAVARVPEVMECYLVTGQYDYLLRVVVRSLEDFERIHREAITSLPGVSRVQTSFALRAVKKESSLPIG